MKEFCKKFCRNKLAVIGLIILAIYLFLAIFANFLFDPELVTYQDHSAMKAPPSKEHILGTDDLGRDLFVRLVYGARTSLSIGFAATFMGLVVGAVIGALCAYVGGWVDQITMRIMDVLFCIPFTLLAMLIVAMLGRTATNLILAVAISNILQFAKITRGCVLSITEQDYIKAARASGTKPLKIVTSHILPNAVSVLTTNAGFTMASSMIAASGLSFIGVGIQPPNPEWGTILAEGKMFITSCPRLVIAPIICLVLATVAVTLVADGVRDALTPKAQA